VQRPQQSKKSKKGRKAERPVPMTLKDNVQIWAWIVGILAVVVTFGIGAMKSNTAQHLDQTINRWRAEFHLTPEQAERMRAIERNFHGTGNPFTLPSHTAEEVRAHHWEIASVMNPSDGERFLNAQEGRKNHR
jgi:hypothetical protein